MARDGSTRRKKALATRRRMIEAAYGLFCERGYAGTTMDAIAEAAGVAVQTLYFTFRTKGAMLSEALGAAVVGFELWDPKLMSRAADLRLSYPELHPWFPGLEQQDGAERALELFVEVSLEVLARVGPLVAVMTAASGSDPEVRAASEVAERRRVEAYTVVAEMLAGKHGLRKGVSVAKATDVLLIVLSAEVHERARARGWSRSAYREWLLEVLSQQLLA